MKTWIKRTLIGLFGASIVVGGLAAYGHRHHGWGGGTLTVPDDITTPYAIVLFYRGHW